MLELAILGVLKDQQLHGYELKKRLTEALGPFSSVSFGSLYPALNRLERAGAVRVVGAAEAEAGEGVDDPDAAAGVMVGPMTGSIAGEAAAYRARRAGAGRRTEPRSSRTRKVYAITETGERLFEELLEGESAGADDDRAFSLKLAFCRFLPPERRLRLMERRRAQLVEKLARTRTSLRTRRERMDTYTRSLVDHGTETAEREISWLDRMIAIERQGGPE
jgi:DNA-binding PadR family transcriptional regulator